MPVVVNGIQHVGIPVRSLERSLRFYREVFGIEAEWIAAGSGPELSRAVDVPATDLSFAFLNLGNTVLELLEYRNPRGKDYDRRNNDVGAIHVCFEVPNIDAAYRQLQDYGVECNAPPNHIEEGPLAGYSFVYFHDPDGITLEIFEVPHQAA